jgi:ribonuclease G
VPRLYPAGSEIIVQVTKGPIGTKGPRITTNLSLPGRYLVLLPNSDQSGISRKIETPRNAQRLKRILRELSIPEGMGVVMRTAGEGKQARYFVRDLALLLAEWRSIQERIQKQGAATCVFEEPDLVARTVRDFLTEDVDRILVDDMRQFERIKEMISRISRRSEQGEGYNEPQPIFDRFNISKQLESTFQRTVHLKSGGYIVIDETEALVAIDVNTGKHKSGKDLDSTILQVNLEAADEIARQLRLRNVGGLIILDFIDMRHPKDQRAVFNRLRDAVRRDKAKTHLLPISPLGLLEMTRQRQTESVQSSVYDDCPYCRGRGRVKSAETMSVEIQRKLVEILKRKRPRDESDFQLRIVVHPTVYERMRRDDEKFIIELEKKFFGKISFRPDPGMHAEHFKIINAISNDEVVSGGLIFKLTRNDPHHARGPQGLGRSRLFGQFRLRRRCPCGDQSFGLAQEMGGAERFGQEECRSRGLGLLARHDMPSSCQHDDRDSRRALVLLEGAERSQAIHFRHQHVHDDEVGLIAQGEIDGLMTVAADEEVEAAFLQAELGETQHVGFVVHDQDSMGHNILGL